jgi:drug/metabolite transporter (DMT)-like permease
MPPRSRAAKRRNSRTMLGAFLAILSAATFAFNNAAARRGVVTGTVIQAMSITVPVGLICFIPASLVTGAAARLPTLSAKSIVAMAGVGLLHFIIGRYCNYRANQAAGANLAAPVVQLQVFVSVVLAVLILGEPCSVLQMLGGVLMLAGSLITQQQPHKPAAAEPAAKSAAPLGHTFLPRRTIGYIFASLAALFYGTSPILARGALEHTGPLTGLVGGLISYGTATTVMALGALSPAFRADVSKLSRENLRWFLYSGLFVAIAQGLWYAALAIAPIMIVAPMMQLSLIFRFGFARTMNRHHEVFGPLVTFGTALAITGACMISIDTNLILDTLALPASIDGVLRWRISG